MIKKVLSLKDTSAAKVVRRYFDHKVGKHGAALAYYLLFALFPMMIFVCNLLGQLDLDIYSITKWMGNFLPHDIVALFESYFEYVAENSSGTMLSFSLIFTLYFPLRATKSLMLDIRLAYGLEKPSRPLSFMVRQLIFTLVLFLAITVSLLFSTFGQRVLVYVLDIMKIELPNYAITLWHYLRFLLIGIFIFASIAGLYAMSLDKRQPLRTVIPGAIVTLIAWLTVSVGFSFYVENISKYSIIYGALGTVIVLMLWLYMISVILIMGAELNQIIIEARQ